MEAEKILLIRTGGLGDSVLLWPGLSAVRVRNPEARIELMGVASRLQVLVGRLGADRALDVTGTGYHKLLQLDPELDEPLRQRFGAYSTVVAFASAGDFVLAENLSACGAGAVHLFMPLPTEDDGLHAAAHLARVFVQAGLAGSIPPDPPILAVDEATRKSGRARLAQVGLDDQRLALIAPGSGSSSKNWSPAGFAEVATALGRLGFSVALMQGPADEQAIEAVQQAAAEALPVLRDDKPMALKGLLANCTLLVGNDAGPGHLAAALGTPVVAVFGPTDPDVWRPVGPHVEVVRAQSGRLDQVDSDVVISACEHLLGTLVH
jgi:heptosyltransferase-3